MWKITDCPNLDSPSKAAIHDVLPLRYVTVIHRGPPWNPESHRDNLPRLAATCGRLPQLAADWSRFRQNPDSAQGRNCERTARRIENYTQKAPHSRSHAGWLLFGLLRYIGQDGQREPGKQKQDKQHCGISLNFLLHVPWLAFACCVSIQVRFQHIYDAAKFCGCQFAAQFYHLAGNRVKSFISHFKNSSLL